MAEYRDMLNRLAKEIEISLRMEEQARIEAEFYWVPTPELELEC